MKRNRFLNPNLSPEQKLLVAKLEIYYPNQCLYLPVDVALSVVAPSLNEYFFDKIKTELSQGFLPFIFLDKPEIKKKTFLDTKKIIFLDIKILEQFCSKNLKEPTFNTLKPNTFNSSFNIFYSPINARLNNDYLVLAEGIETLKVYFEKIDLDESLKELEVSPKNKPLNLKIIKV